MTRVWGRSIPNKGVTIAVCLRHPLALGIDIETIPAEDDIRCRYIAIIVGCVEMSITVFA